MRVIFFVLIVSSACTLNQPKKIEAIRIEINGQNQFLVNNKLIRCDELKKAVLEEKKRIISNGIKAEEVKVIIEVSSSAPISHQGCIQTVLRQLDLRDIEYTGDREERGV